MKTLIGHGANINIQNESGQTVLMRAAAANQPQIIKYLISMNGPIAVAIFGLIPSKKSKGTSVLVIMKKLFTM